MKIGDESRTGVESWDLKNRWLKDVMSEHGEWLCDRFRDALERNKNVKSGDLDNAIDYETKFDSTAFGYTELHIRFFDYGRMFEINGYKKKKQDVNVNRDVWQIKENRMKKKNTRWYAVNMYSGIGKLIERISAGMTEQERERVFGILNENK